jgi:hypothetical protein
MKIAAGFDSGPGMIEQLRELADAEPFKPFSVRLQTGEEYEIETKKAIEFTHYGSPKVLDGERWHILNVDAIAEIIV